METKEEDKIQDADIIPEAKPEEPLTQTLGDVLGTKSADPVRESSENMPEPKAEETIPGVVSESANETAAAFGDSEILGDEDMEKKTKKEFRSRLALVFVLGFLIGIALKTEALKKVTIGYDDYLMKIKSQSYDINEIQTKLQNERETAAQLEEQSDPTVDGSGNVSEDGEKAVQEGTVEGQVGN